MKSHRSDGIDPAARSRARRRALQAIYAWQMSGQPIAKVIEQFRDEQDMEIADLDYFDSDYPPEDNPTMVWNLDRANWRPA